MKIEFSTAGDNNYAMNPQTEKRGGRRLLRMAQRGCTHFLIITAPLNVQPDLGDSDLRNGLEQIGDELLKAKDTPLPDQENVTVTCVSYMTFRRDNEYIELPDKAANYAICGCHYGKEEDVFRILLPTNGMGYKTSVAVEIRYTMKPHCKVTKKFWHAETERTPFYEVFFEKKSAFIDGSVVYTIGQKPYRFPLTEQMLGKTILIKTDGEIPQFTATTSGVILKNE